MQQSESLESRFLASLETLARTDQRAALAALRRGLGKKPGRAPEMYPYVVPFVPRRASSELEGGLYLVAALFAWHPVSWHRGEGEFHTNLGASLRQVFLRTDSESIQSRFVALLNAPSDDLPIHLRHAVGLCKAHEVAVDYIALLRDIQRWDGEPRRVQRQWAAAFWERPESSVETEPPPQSESKGEGNVP